MHTIQEQKREVLERGIKSLLEESSIPRKVHLAMVQALKKELDGYRLDLESLQEERDEEREEYVEIKQRTVSRVDALANSLTKLIDSCTKELNRVKAIDPKKLKGDTGKSVELKDVIEGLRPHLPKAAQSFSRDEIIAGLIPFIPEPDMVERKDSDLNLDMDSLYEGFIERIKKERPIDISNIKNAESFMFNKKRYKIEELMKGGGSNGSSSTANILTQYNLAATQNGSNAVVALSQLTHFATLVGVIVAYRNQIPQTNGAVSGPTVTCTISATDVTFYNADATEIFSITYTYA